MLNLASFSTLFTLLLPFPVAFVAGILRQDGFSEEINDTLAWIVVILAAVLDALFNGKLTSNVYLDFMAIASYTGALVHTKPFTPLQHYLQSNVLSVFKKPASAVSQAVGPVVADLAQFPELQALASQVQAMLYRLDAWTAQPLAAPPVQAPVATVNSTAMSQPPGMPASSQFVSMPLSAQQALDRGWSSLLPSVSPPQQ